MADAFHKDVTQVGVVGQLVIIGMFHKFTDKDWKSFKQTNRYQRDFVTHIIDRENKLQ